MLPPFAVTGSCYRLTGPAIEASPINLTAGLPSANHHVVPVGKIHAAHRTRINVPFVKKPSPLERRPSILRHQAIDVPVHRLGLPSGRAQIRSNAGPQISSCRSNHKRHSLPTMPAPQSRMSGLRLRIASPKLAFAPRRLCPCPSPPSFRSRARRHKRCPNDLPQSSLRHPDQTNGASGFRCRSNEFPESLKRV